MAASSNLNALRSLLPPFPHLDPTWSTKCFEYFCADGDILLLDMFFDYCFLCSLFAETLPQDMFQALNDMSEDNSKEHAKEVWMSLLSASIPWPCNSPRLLGNITLHFWWRASSLSSRRFSKCEDRSNKHNSE